MYVLRRKKKKKNKINECKFKYFSLRRYFKIIYFFFFLLYLYINMLRIKKKIVSNENIVLYVLITNKIMFAYVFSK